MKHLFPHWHRANSNEHHKVISTLRSPTQPNPTTQFLLVYLQSLKPNAHLFANLTKALNLTQVQEVVLAYSLTHSEHPDLRHLANDHLQASLLKLIQSHIEVGEQSLPEFTPPE